MSSEKLNLQVGDVVKIWRRSFGGQGRDYVIIGRLPGSPKDDPIIVILNKNHLKKDGDLSARAKFFMLQARKVQNRLTKISHIDIEQYIETWQDGKVKQSVAKLN